jgi:polyisoprenoid-binding protein YceI
MRLLKPLFLFTLAITLARPAFADEWKIDGPHSALVFRVQHLGVSNTWGVIPSPEGKITWDSADPAKSSIEVTAKLASLTTHNTKRDEHLRSPDFFDAKQFPTMTFKSTSIKKTGDNTFEVTGDLTIRGTTRPITVTLTQVGTAEMNGKAKTGFDGSFTINRQDFGVSYMPQGIGNEVTIFVALEANRG